MGDFGVEKEIEIIGGLDAAVGADRGVAGLAEDDVRATEDEGKKNCEGGEQDQSTEEQESSVSAFHTLKESPSAGGNKGKVQQQS